MSRPLNMPPFSVSLYMSLRTLPISLGRGERKEELSCVKWTEDNYESLSMEEGDSKFHISFFSSVRFLGRWLTVARIKGSSERQTGSETVTSILHHNVKSECFAIRCPLFLTASCLFLSVWHTHTQTHNYRSDRCVNNASEKQKLLGVLVTYQPMRVLCRAVVQQQIWKRYLIKQYE